QLVRQDHRHRLWKNADSRQGAVGVDTRRLLGQQDIWDTSRRRHRPAGEALRVDVYVIVIVVGRVGAIAPEPDAAVVVVPEVAAAGHVNGAVDAYLERGIRTRAEPDRNDVRLILIDRRDAGRQRTAVNVVKDQPARGREMEAGLVIAVGVLEVGNAAFARLRSGLEQEAVENGRQVVEGLVGLANHRIGHA